MLRESVLTLEIRKHEFAESGLIGIWAYTFHEWDAAEADKYLDELDDGIKELAENPEMGAKRDYLREGYRVLLMADRSAYPVQTGMPAGERVQERVRSLSSRARQFQGGPVRSTRVAAERSHGSGRC